MNRAESMIALLTEQEKSLPLPQFVQAFPRINRRLGACEICGLRFTTHPRRDHDFTRRDA